MNSIKQLLNSIAQTFLQQPLSIWRTATADWSVHLEKPMPEEELRSIREAASIPSFSFFFVLISASVIATFGLLVNSAAVIIGAMIVAPLMNPILSTSFAIVTGNWKLYKRSLITVCLGSLTPILVAYIISLIIPLHIVGSEITGRVAPNLVDLGIAIAAGAAGSFALTRKSVASSIAGVAIAVALVPPLCVVGIGLGIGGELATTYDRLTVTNIDASTGAFLLFFTNLSAIIFTACLVFLSQSYGSLKKGFNAALVWLLIMIILFGPLSHSLSEFLLVNRVKLSIREFRTEHPEISSQTRVHHVNVEVVRATANILIIGSAPHGVITDEYLADAEQKIFDDISGFGIDTMNMRMRISPVTIVEHNLSRSR